MNLPFSTIMKLAAKSVVTPFAGGGAPKMPAARPMQPSKHIPGAMVDHRMEAELGRDVKMREADDSRIMHIAELPFTEYMKTAALRR